MASDLDQLVAMGFEQEKAQLALQKSGNLPSAIDWLEVNADRTVEDIQQEAAASAGDTADAASGTQAMSMVCNDCGRKLRNMAAAQYHAEKTGHDDFAESTEEIAPLTPAEKQQRLQELKEKLTAKRAGQADEDKKANARNAQILKKHTKENDEAKEALQRKEQIKEAQAKKAEKLADVKAKERIKAKIEADKEARRQKAEQDKAMRANPDAFNPGAPGVPVPVAAAPKVTTNHAEARLRLQTAGGDVMKTFPAETTLFEVAHALQSEGIEAQTFTTAFPRKTFEQSDFGMTLKEAGWVPSAAIVVK